MNASKLVTLVNAHVAANTPKRGISCVITSSKLQDAEQKAFELTQPKLTPAEEQEIELIRYLGNEEAEHARFNSNNSSNLQGC